MIQGYIIVQLNPLAHHEESAGSCCKRFMHDDNCIMHDVSIHSEEII